MSQAFTKKAVPEPANQAPHSVASNRFHKQK
jgi:hypothetical protein